MESLLNLARDPQDSVFDLAIEIGRLVGLAHSYILTGDRDQLVGDYLVSSMHSRAIQRHLLTIDTTTVAGHQGIVGSEELCLANLQGNQRGNGI